MNDELKQMSISIDIVCIRNIIHGVQKRGHNILGITLTNIDTRVGW